MERRIVRGQHEVLGLSSAAFSSVVNVQLSRSGRPDGNDFLSHIFGTFLLFKAPLVNSGIWFDILSGFVPEA